MATVTVSPRFCGQLPQPVNIQILICPRCGSTRPRREKAASLRLTKARPDAVSAASWSCVALIFPSGSCKRSSALASRISNPVSATSSTSVRNRQNGGNRPEQVVSKCRILGQTPAEFARRDHVSFQIAFHLAFGRVTLVLNQARRTSARHVSPGLTPIKDHLPARFARSAIPGSFPFQDQKAGHSCSGWNRICPFFLVIRVRTHENWPPNVCRWSTICAKRPPKPAVAAIFQAKARVGHSQLFVVVE